MKKLSLIYLFGVSLAVIILGLIAFNVFFISAQENTSQTVEDIEDSKKLNVTATFYPLAEFAQQIGKTNAVVLNLTPTGVEPHDFEPSPQDLVELQGSDIIIYNGAGLEPWIEKLDEDLKKNVVVDSSKDIELIPADPHVWMDPVLAMQQVENITQGFMLADPDQKDFYQQNSEQLKTQLHDLDAEFREGLMQCETRDIVTSHNAFQYLAKRYQLNVKSISGLSPDEEPSAKKLAEVVDFVKDNSVKFIFFETLVSPKLSETIAQETGARTIAFNPLEGLTEEEIAEGKNYFSIQKENLASLRTALRCK